MACASNFWYLLYLVIGILFGILLLACGKRASFQLHMSSEEKDLGVHADHSNNGTTVGRVKGQKVGTSLMQAYSDLKRDEPGCIRVWSQPQAYEDEILGCWLSELEA